MENQKIPTGLPGGEGCGGWRIAGCMLPISLAAVAVRVAGKLGWGFIKGVVTFAEEGVALIEFRKNKNE